MGVGGVTEGLKNDYVIVEQPLSDHETLVLLFDEETPLILKLELDKAHFCFQSVNFEATIFVMR